MALTKPTSATVFGTSGADYLIGTAGDDTFSGAATLSYAGDGVDTFEGFEGNDQYLINNTAEVVIEAANAGIDTIFSSVTYSLLTAPEVENIAAVLSGTTTLTGNAKDNILDGTTSAVGIVNTLVGMEGSDTYFAEAADKVIEGKLLTATATQYTDTGGNDTLYISANKDVTINTPINNAGQLVSGSDNIKGQAFIENVILTGTAAVGITGNSLNNRLTGNNAANTLVGNAGDDVLSDGGAGAADTLIGGLGNDTYIIRNTSAIIQESTTINEGTDTVKASVNFDISGANTKFIENLTLLGTAQSAIGNDLNNVLTGNGADNTLTGNAGADTLIGGLGADTMIGGTGNDVYTVDNGSDKVIEIVGATPAEIALNGGADLVNSSITFALNTTDAAGVENLTLTGTAAISATGNSLNNALTGNIAANTLTGNDGNDTIIGNDGNDTVNGGNGDDKLYGGNDNDTLNGGAGNDTMDGGQGVDVLKGGAGNDTYVIDDATELNSSGELATVGEIDSVFSNVTYTLPANIENLTLTGLGTYDSVAKAYLMDGTGNAGNNILTGNTANNILTGKGGADQFLGMSGADTLIGGAGNDIFTGGAGADTVTTGNGQDTLKFAFGVTDTVASANSVAGIDIYKDLSINAGTLDVIDLTVVVATVGAAVSGDITGASFVSSMNAALNKSGAGFDTAIAGDISAAVVTVSGAGDATVSAGDQFLAVDLDKSGTFTTSDFVIEITGSTITSLTTATFI